MKLSETEQKNNLVADQIMESIIKIHGHLRPFIVIFPDPEETGRVSSITNITTVETVSFILEGYLNSLEDTEEMEFVEVPVTN